MNDLSHYGVMGMHWGIRQDKKRLEKLTGSDNPDHVNARALKKKKLSEMSNAEIKTLVARINLEKQFKDVNKKQAEIVAEKIAKMLGGTIGGLGKAVVVGGTAAALSPIIREAIKAGLKKKGVNLPG